MKKPAIIVFLFVVLSLTASGQEPTLVKNSTAPNAAIEKVEISGVPEQSLSSGLREDLQKLVGQLYDATIASQFADRIQSELAHYLAAPRTIPGTQPDKLRLVFVVARAADDAEVALFVNDELKVNINAQYTVESVEFDGVPRSQVSDGLSTDIQKMVGQRLDNKQAEQLRDRLAAELKPGYQILWRVRRGTQSQRVKIVYRARRVPWIPSRTREPFLVYHSKEGFSGAIGQRLFRQNDTTINWEIANNADELVERYAGWRLGFESLRLGTDRLGVRLDYSIYRAQWERQTIEAQQSAPANFGIYRLRRTVEPSVAFAFNRNLYISAGSSISELQMQSPAMQSESARAAVGSIRYHRSFQTPNTFHDFESGYEVRTGTRALDSDFVYTRHFWDAHYGFHDQNIIPGSMINLDFHAGLISGGAPLFERFTLGDTRTLRGWNKFDVAPLGGSRVAYGSLSYRYRMLQLFYDVGSVWDAGARAQVRQSVGFGLRETAKDKKSDTGRCFDKDDFFGCWFINVGIPIRNARLEPTITLGIGF